MSEARAIAREAFSHFAKKEHDEAIRLYRLALDADDRFAIAWNGLSMALSQAGDLDGAIEAARRLAELEHEVRATPTTTKAPAPAWRRPPRRETKPARGPPPTADRRP